jgi:formyl-CoA transferase
MVKEPDIGDLPLAGITVLDVSSFIAAPVAATVMADYGADVIKVEPPGEGDPNRHMQRLASYPKAPAVNYPWQMDSRGKRSIVVDLKSDQGREVLMRLVARSDVLITNYPLRVRRALKIGYDEVKDVNSRLIYASFTGYGEHGPDADQVGFDSTAYFARSGLMDSSRYEGQPPAAVMPAQGDRASGVALFSAIMLALFERARTGTGTLVSTSLLANGIWANGVTAQAALVNAFLPLRPPPDRPRNAVTNVYRCSDDRWLMLTMVQEDKGWAPFCQAIGRPELVADARFATSAARRQNATPLAEIIGQWFAGRTSDDAIAVLKPIGVPYSIIGRVSDLRDDPQARASGAIVETALPNMPLTIAAPFRVGSHVPQHHRGAPALGAQTDQILAEAGYGAAEIAALRSAGAIA